MDNKPAKQSKMQEYSLTSASSIMNLSNELAKFIKDKKLCMNIKGKEYVLVEAWTFAGMSMGLCPVVTDLINESTNEEVKYRSVVELLNIHTNTVVGRGFAVCSNKEKGKKFFDEYAIASMAQTRATGKAYRLPLGFLMKAAGYEATPAEEMDFNGNTPEIKVEPAPVQRKEEYGPDGKLRVNGQTYEEAKATAQQPTITNPMEQPTHDAEGNPINYASAKQKEEIIRLLNNPVITRQEKTKMLLNINKLDEERANQAIAKLKKVIEAREAECGAGGGASEPGE